MPLLGFLELQGGAGNPLVPLVQETLSRGEVIQPQLLLKPEINVYKHSLSTQSQAYHQAGDEGEGDGPGYVQGPGALSRSCSPKAQGSLLFRFVEGR